MNKLAYFGIGFLLGSTNIGKSLMNIIKTIVLVVILSALVLIAHLNGWITI